MSLLEKYQASEERAKTVLVQLEGIRDNTKSKFFELCDLLLESYEGEFHKFWGYSRFGEWIDASKLEISGRLAYYYVTIAQKSRELGISREEMAKLSQSSLREIFSLDHLTHADDIKQLIAGGEDLSVDQVKEKVKALKHKTGEEVYSHLNVKIPALAKEIVEEAFELARKLHGSIVNQETGEVVDISDGKCLEYIAAAFLMDPNNHEQGIDSFVGRTFEAPVDDIVVAA